MSEMIARVQENQGTITGGSVELFNGVTKLTGRVAAESENQFAVDWEDGQRTIENKSDYELIVTTKTANYTCTKPGCNSVANEYGVCEDHDMRNMLTVGLPKKKDTGANEIAASVAEASENPAQPAGWAVAPVDANAYPNGELIEIEEEKRAETAGWEDAQNRAPVDGENPAQPAGYAVPPASGQPIPGQGADGLMMAASVHAEDASGENGVVTLSNGDLKIAGRVLASDDDSFIVEWEDGRRTVESKSDYDLIVGEEVNNDSSSLDKLASEISPEHAKAEAILNHEVDVLGDGAHACKMEGCDTVTASENDAVRHFLDKHDADYDWDMLPGADDRD